MKYLKDPSAHTWAQQQQKQKHISKKENEPEHYETRMGILYLLKLYRFLGVRMPNNYKFLYLCWSFLVNMVVTVYLPIGFSMTFFTMSTEELQIGNLLTSVQAFINDLACSTKIITMAICLPKLVKCEPILRKLDKRCRTKQEFQAIKDFIQMGNRIVALFAFFNGCYTTSTCISALICHRLPYNMYNPLINSKASSINFYACALIEAIVVNLAICQQTADDSYPVVYVNILRTHLNILLNRIKNLNANTSDSLENNVEELKRCIIDHKDILEIYDIVAPIISLTIFVQFSVTAAILCTILINILIFATDFASIVASCIYVMVVIGETFPLCYYAQCLMDESNSLANVLFHSNWVDQNKRYRKMLIFFIHRSQRTINFTAGKLFPITLNSFLSIAKFSFSLYTFIIKMGLKERFAAHTK